jgi:PTS system mannose-specific IIA component
MSEPVVGVVIVTHGLLATELLNAAETIVGDLSRFTAVSIGWHDDVPVATSAMERVSVAAHQLKCLRDEVA